MKEFIITQEQTERAVLVGLVTPEQSEAQVKEYLDELAFLAETAGIEPVRRFTQKADKPHAVTFVGSGKLQQIGEYVAENESFRPSSYETSKRNSRYASWTVRISSSTSLPSARRLPTPRRKSSWRSTAICFPV